MMYKVVTQVKIPQFIWPQQQLFHMQIQPTNRKQRQECDNIFNNLTIHILLK